MNPALVEITPVAPDGAAPVPRVVIMPHDRWRQWLGDIAGAPGGSWIKLLSDDEYPLDGAYLALGVHPLDAPARANQPLFALHGGLTALGPLAAISAEWQHPTQPSEVVVCTTLDAGDPFVRSKLTALAEQSEVPVLFCDADTGRFIAQTAVEVNDTWRLRLRRLLAETTGAPSLGDPRVAAHELVLNSLGARRTVPTRSVIGRNDPCPCARTDEAGRPRKFKRCCGEGR